MSIRRQSMTGGSWLIKVSGRLDQTQTPLLEAEVNSLLDENIIHLAVDLSEVSYINSGGLRALVTVWRRANQLGGDVVLCCLNPDIAQVFSIVGFDKVFTMTSTHAAAQKALKGQ